MTVLIPFNPSPSANFQFQCTLDGAPYNVICTFNAYGQRYYINVYDLNGTLVFSRPLIASPSFKNLSLTLGYFETTMIYRESSQTFEIPGIEAVPLVRPPPPAYTPPGPPPPPPPPSPDPYFADVALLLHGEGATGSTDIVDSSLNDIAMVTVGSVTIENTIEHFSGGAISFAAGNWLYSNNTVFNFDSRSFTVEGWFYMPTLISSDRGQSIFCTGMPGSTVDGAGVLWIHADGVMEYYSADALGNNPLDVGTAAGVYQAGQWNFVPHTQLVIGSDSSNVGNEVYIHLNGNLVASRSGPVSATYPANITIGNYGPLSTSIPFTGYVQEYRVTLGVARYTAADYAVPTARFPGT